jgi:hypothetical protein
MEMDRFGCSRGLKACGIGVLIFGLGCAPRYVASLPSSAELEAPSGYSIRRVITHLHSPYSWDACDKVGITGGVLNASCLKNLRLALCANRIDYAFVTDHPDAMASYEFSDLVLSQSGDTVLSTAGKPYGNRVGDCVNGAQPVILPGYESRLMPLGMTEHLDPTISVRNTLYGEETSTVRNQLQTTSGAIVAIPHTESRTTATILSIVPDAMEIYNLHANLDPKIRYSDLGLPPFSRMPGMLAFLLDPYGGLNADFMFLAFLEVHSVYAKRWAEVINGGLKITGIFGTDSHENIFSQTARDGERLDGHRRTLRMMSNHVLVTTDTVAGVKSALQAGRVWGVFEGLGTPVGMRFTATVGGTTVGTGQTISIGGGSARIQVTLPRLHADSPRGSLLFRSPYNPPRSITLKRMSAGSEATVAEVDDADLDVTVSAAGAYRVEVRIRPIQVAAFIGAFEDLTANAYPWVLTNPIYVDP